MPILDRLGTVTEAEWVDLKSDEQIKLKPVTNSRFTSGRDEIEMRSLVRITGGVAVYIRAWRDGNPLGFGPDGSVEIERVQVINPPILVPDPLGSYVIVWIDPKTGTRHELRYREDTALALRQILFRILPYTGKEGAKIVPGKTGRTTTTFNPNAGTGTATDAMFDRDGVDETFSTIRGGAGVNIQESSGLEAAGLSASATTDQFEKLARGGFGFATGTLPDTDTIDSATLDLVGSVVANTGLGDNGFGIVAFNPVDPDVLAASDFGVSNWGGTDFATRINASAWSTSGANSYSLNASGLAHIDQTDDTYFGLRVGWDIDNSFGGTWASGEDTRVGVLLADTAGTANDPLLTVNHTGAGPPTNTLTMMGHGI